MPDRGWLETLELYCSFQGMRGSRYDSYEEGELKREKFFISKFDFHEAFEIGTLATKLAKEQFCGKPVVIDISLQNEHCLFRAVTNTGRSLDDETWIKRNREIAMRFGHSSFFVALDFKDRLSAHKGAYFYLDSREYGYFDGGAFPIFTDSCEFPVACLTVSGLEQYENHWLAVESVRDYAMRINDSAGK